MNLPNLLSVGRIALVPLFFYLMTLPEPNSSAKWWALGIYGVAAVTDALDGYLARLWNQVTSLGKMIDPVADKLLILSGFIVLHITPQPVFEPPIWVTGIVLFREMVFTGGLITFTLLKKKMPAEPNLLGKTTTLAQICAVIICLLGAVEAKGVLWLTVFLTVLSGFIYTLRGARFLARKEI